jgi:hypothetical protein
MIKSTMCRLSDLTQEQIDRLVAVMPGAGCFDFNTFEGFIGFTSIGTSGTWKMADNSTIVTYTEMMQLLGVDMKKETAQEQMKILQAEMDKMQAIIDKPTVKAGRVMHVDDLGDFYYQISNICKPQRVGVMHQTANLLIEYVSMSLIFHDEQSCNDYIEYLKLEQKLRIAQVADGGAGTNTTILTKSGRLHNEPRSCYHEKISFNTHSARNAFRTAHTDEQLKLLIRGVS